MFFAASDAARSRSITAKVEMSDVSFSRIVQILPRPGSATRTNYGRVTKAKTWRLAKPRERAASICPCGTAESDASQTSLE